MAFNTSTANAPALPVKRPFYFRPGPIISILLVGFLTWFVLNNIFSWQATGVRQENGIQAQLKSNKNDMGQHVLTVKEALGVAKVNNAELEKVIRSALEGRYGNDGEGAKAAMLWVTENYPGTYDPSMMKTVQQTIIAGRVDFQAKQDILIDKVRVYKDMTDTLYSGTWLKLVGFPRASFKWEDYEPVVAEGTKEMFETKVDKGIEIK